MTNVNTPTRKKRAKRALTLFTVTLDWNTNNREEGDYADKVWARDETHAVKLLAEDMAWHEDSGCETAAERKRFVKAAVESAYSTAAERVASAVLSDCEALLAGPENAMTPEAAADFATLSAILKKYGAR